MSTNSLESRIRSAGGAFNMLYHSGGAPFAFPVQAEFSNWRDEQEAWGRTAIFQDMSHHMCNVCFEGPDVVKLLSDLGINSFAGFGPMQAKQYVACNDEGQYVGDAILTCEEQNKVWIVGKPSLPNWIRFHLAAGKYTTRTTHFDPPSPKLADRTVFRFQVQGPTAQEIFEELHGGALPEIGFFKMGRIKIGPHEVTALNHRMSGAPGFEFWGPSSIGEDVRQRVLAAGQKHGMRRIGGKVYPVTAAESGWIGTALPAIYTGKSTRAYREWLPEDGYEGAASMGGSYPGEDLERLYVTPAELGYGFMTRFDHEFRGRAALEGQAGNPQRRKVRLHWRTEDALAVHGSLLRPDGRHKYMEMPVANYSTFQMDEVLDGGRRVGMSFYPVYSVSSRAWISLAIIEASLARDGQELTLTWGEAGGGSKKPTVERHVQKSVRVTVDSQPIKRA